MTFHEGLVRQDIDPKTDTRDLYRDGTFLPLESYRQIVLAMYYLRGAPDTPRFWWWCGGELTRTLCLPVMVRQFIVSAEMILMCSGERETAASMIFAARRFNDRRCRRVYEKLTHPDTRVPHLKAFVWLHQIARRHPGAGKYVFIDCGGGK